MILQAYLSVCLPVCLPTYLPVCLSVCLSKEWCLRIFPGRTHILSYLKREEKSCILDHHFDWIDTQAQLFALGYGVGHPAAAVGHLCVKVHPVARLGLCHEEDVHLKEEAQVDGQGERARGHTCGKQ